MSESAVLEVSSADADDSSGGSLESSRAELQDGDAAPPLLMEPNCDIAVKVDAPMKQLSTLETYVTYRVRCACARWATPPYVRRRYNHFKALRQRLATTHPLLPVPPLPPLHTARQQLDRYAAGFVAVRTHALHAFLERVAKHPILTHSEELRAFLAEGDDETLERALRADGGGGGGGGGGGSLWALGGVLSGLGGDSRSAAALRVKEPEFAAASDYLQSLQHKLTTLAALTGRLHKGSAALARELSSMKPVADAWCSHERGALAAAARAAGAGAAAAGAARGGEAAAARARLPQLAAYAAVVRDKILERDALHNTYLTSSNAADDTHNRLEQASEALRAELADWNGKTKAEIKDHLLEIAERQLRAQRQALHAWEAALGSCRDADVFRTVSRSAVLNLSPSRANVDGAAGSLSPEGKDGSVGEKDSPSEGKNSCSEGKVASLGEKDSFSEGKCGHSGDKDSYSEGKDVFSKESDGICEGKGISERNYVSSEGIASFPEGLKNSSKRKDSFSEGEKNTLDDDFSKGIGGFSVRKDDNSKSEERFSEGKKDASEEGKDVHGQSKEGNSKQRNNDINEQGAREENLYDPLNAMSVVDFSESDS